LIINAAIDVFSNGDFEKATMRSIADKAGVPTTSIYNYFKNKDDLYVTLIKLIVDRTNRELNAHLLGINDIKNKIKILAKHQLEYFEANPNIAYLVFASTNISYWYQHSSALEKARESSAVLVKIIEEGKSRKKIRADINSHIIVHMFFGAMRAMVINWLYSKQIYKLSDMADYLADYIYSGIAFVNPDKPEFICPLLTKANQQALYE
jgi:AcrR family transcriptional regulator